MVLKVRDKILIITVTILLLAIGAHTLVISRILRKEYTTALQSKMDVIANTLRSHIERLLGLGISIENIEGFEAQCQEILRKYQEVAYVMVTRLNGEILFHNDPAYQGTRINDPHISEALTHNRQMVCLYKVAGQMYYNTIVPVRNISDEPIAFVIVGFPTKLIDDKVHGLLRYSFWVALASLALATFVLLISLSISTTKPLSSLVATIQQIRESSDLNKRVAVKSADEIGLLADAFNTMTENLQKTTTSIDNLNREITERKQAEKALRQREQFLSTIFSSIQDGISILDTDLNIIRVNSAMEQWYAHNMPLTGKKCYESYHGRNQPCDVCPTLQTIKTGKSAYEVVSKTAEGGKIVGWLDLYTFPLIDPITGQISGVIEYVRDITERKKTEEQLRKTEERYRTQFEGALDAIFVADAETGIIVDCNPAATRLVGRGKSELVGKHQRILHPPERIEGEFSDTFKEHLEKKQGQTLETQVVTKTGERKDVAIKASLIEFSGKKLLQGIFRDVTDRKKAEEALKESEKRLNTILNSIITGVVIVDAETHKIVDSNPLATKIIGLPKEEIVGKLCHKFICPAEKGRCPISDLGQTVDQSERVLIKGDGKEIPILKTVTPTSWQGHSYFVESFIDLSKRKQAETALKKSEERFKQVAESAGDWIWEVNAEGLYTYSSPIAEKILGYKPEEIVGKKYFYDFFAPNVKEQFKKAAFETFAKAEPFVGFINSNIHKNGSIIVLETRGIPILDDAGNFIGYRGADTDITERKKAEEYQAQLLENLEKTNKELNDLVYIMSHDLKTPLRGISTLVNWLLTDYVDKFDQEGKDRIDLLLGRVSRMYSLIDGILRYSEVGRVKEEKKPVNLNELMPLIIDIIAPRENITITIENELPVVECEETRITQVFQSLLSNAVKYMDKPQGQIKIGCIEDDQFWKFSVSDNGPGIEEKYFDKIFQIFQTLSPRDEVESTGVGLTVAKKIVEMYGGWIWVESKVGQGSTFFFTLPRQETGVTNEKLKVCINC